MQSQLVSRSILTVLAAIVSIAVMPSHTKAQQVLRLDSATLWSFTDYATRTRASWPWVARIGDDMRWKDRDLDDSQWAAMSPAASLPDSIRIISQSMERAGVRGIMWFRMHVHVDSAVVGRASVRWDTCG